jgi:hypothetical protein
MSPAVALEQKMSELERTLENLKGGAEVLDTLREEFSQWLGEANEEGQREAYENVLGHVDAMVREYAHRLQEAVAQPQAPLGSTMARAGRTLPERL